MLVLHCFVPVVLAPKLIAFNGSQLSFAHGSFLGRFSNLKQHLEPFEIPSVYEKNKRTAYLVG